MRALLRHHRHAGRAVRRPAPSLASLLHRRGSGPASARPEQQVSPAAAQAQAQAQASPIATEMDFAARRVRAAGGPTDLARYTCACGYAFDAPVSATVSCPHCGGDQAW